MNIMRMFREKGLDIMSKKENKIENCTLIVVQNEKGFINLYIEKKALNLNMAVKQSFPNRKLSYKLLVYKDE